jgi:release factor glutamine methyltransferase
MSGSAVPPPSSSSLPPDLRPGDVITRLRAAGCVFAEDEARLLISAADSPAELRAMVERRVAGLPLEHVLGWAEFCGLRIAVDPGVFVPRRRTEFLVDQAVALARQAGPQAVVVDLCCGSGAVGAAVAAALGAAGGGAGDAARGADGEAARGATGGRVELHAADIDPASVACAQRNVAAAGGRVYQGDLFEPLPGALRGRVTLLTANVPYIPTGAIGTLPAEARVHEPLAALDGGADGLDVARRVAAGAPLWLAPGGHMLIETSAGQAPLAAEAFAAAGLIPRIVTSDELDATVIIGTSGP